MIQTHHTLRSRTAVRQHRDWLLGVLAVTTLVLSWYFSAALDASTPRHAAVEKTSAISEFDAAFVAANAQARLPDEMFCAVRLAQTQAVRAPL